MWGWPGPTVGATCWDPGGGCSGGPLEQQGPLLAAWGVPQPAAQASCLLSCAVGIPGRAGSDGQEGGNPSLFTSAHTLGEPTSALCVTPHSSHQQTQPNEHPLHGAEHLPLGSRARAPWQGVCMDSRTHLEVNPVLYGTRTPAYEAALPILPSLLLCQNNLCYGRCGRHSEVSPSCASETRPSLTSHLRTPLKRSSIGLWTEERFDKKDTMLLLPLPPESSLSCFAGKGMKPLGVKRQMPPPIPAVSHREAARHHFPQGHCHFSAREPPRRPPRSSVCAAARRGTVASGKSPPLSRHQVPPGSELPVGTAASIPLFARPPHTRSEPPLDCALGAAGPRGAGPRVLPRRGPAGGTSVGGPQAVWRRRWRVHVLACVPWRRPGAEVQLGPPVGARAAVEG